MHPVLFRLGSFPVYSYGVMLLAALLVGTFVAGRVFVRNELELSQLYLLVAVIAVSGLVGARVFYVVGHFSEFSGHLARMFDTNTVGLVYYGGLIFAFPAAILTTKRLKLPTATVVGAAALALPLGLGIARIGCFLNGCCGGKPSGLPWAVTFPGTTTPVHPTQLYEAILDVALFVVLLVLISKFVDGWDLMLCSLAGYAAIRFFMEFFRFHSKPDAGLFFQLLSAAIFVASIGALLLRRRAGKPAVKATAGPEDKPYQGNPSSGSS